MVESSELDNALSGSSPLRPVQSTSSLLGDTSRFLTARPSPSRICQFLVFHTSWPAKPWSAALAQCSEDGVLHLTGSFGIGRELVDAYESMPLHEPAPIVEAVTTASPVVYVGDSILARRYPGIVADLRAERGFSDHMTLVDVPLLSYAGPMGSFGMFFEGTDHSTEELVCSMEQIAALLTVYLETTQATPSSSPTPPRAIPLSTSFDLDVDPALLPVALTKRQIQVLGLMAQRMSNREIADALDYSESTIRLDATVIFRALGVNSRREAVAAARAQGLVMQSRVS